MDEDKGWSKGLGIDLKVTKAISLYLIPCIKFHLAFLKDRNNTLRIGDIWIPWLSISPNHFVKLYIPSAEDFVSEWKPIY